MYHLLNMDPNHVLLNAIRGLSTVSFIRFILTDKTIDVTEECIVSAIKTNNLAMFTLIFENAPDHLRTTEKQKAYLTAAVRYKKKKIINLLFDRIFPVEIIPSIIALNDIALMERCLHTFIFDAERDADLLLQCLEAFVCIFSAGKIRNYTETHRIYVLAFVDIILSGANTRKLKRHARPKFDHLFDDEFFCPDKVDLYARFFIAIGDLDALKDLHKRGLQMSTTMFDIANRLGHIHIMFYLREYQTHTTENKRYQKLLTLMESAELRASKTIRYWWIPIVYDMNRPSGMRMFWLNYEDSCRISGWKIPTEEEKRESEEKFKKDRDE